MASHQQYIVSLVQSENLKQSLTVSARNLIAHLDEVATFSKALNEDAMDKSLKRSEAGRYNAVRYYHRRISHSAVFLLRALLPLHR